MDLDLNIGAVASQSLVNGVIDDLEHHVVQARAIIRIADIHPRRLRTASRPFSTLIFEES